MILSRKENLASIPVGIDPRIESRCHAEWVLSYSKLYDIF